ncbi:MAG TPA: tetratricopeptide repeat protein [Gemmatimonadales bacterium]|nr:tetratricopeptide repeat protein [Gemmatimonadales bacterium]
MRRAAVALLLCAAPLAAQRPAADSAWTRGDYAHARTLYESALTADSTDARSLHRLAILDAWDGKFERALARLARLRLLTPGDADVMVDQARTYAWANQNAAALALYDSVLAHDPTRADALAGRARAVAWSGDLERAEALWRDALAAHPDDPEILIGLAQTLYWNGQAALAETYVAKARAHAPADRAALELERQLAAELRPEVRTTFNGAGDSDHNDFWAQEAYLTGSLGAARGTVQAGWRRATLGSRSAASYGAGGYAVMPLGHGAVLRAGAGVRRLAPELGAGTTLATAQLGLGIRPAPFVSAGISYSRSPFDETVVLIDSAIAVNGLDLSLDLAPRSRVSFSGGGGVAWLSDGNRRSGGVAAVLAGVGGGLQLGVYGRLLSYRQGRPGVYFAPDRFTILEARAVYAWRRGQWGARGDGGFGTQQVLKSGTAQSEWHLGLSLSREWWSNGEIRLGGAITNSAVSSTTGAFRYRSITLSVRQGL